MCTDALRPAISDPSVAKADEATVLANNDVPAGKRPTIRFSFMGRNVEDLTDDDEPCMNELDANDETDENDLDSVVDDTDSEQVTLEDEKRMIREQLMLITSQLGQLTSAEHERKKHKRRHTFPDRDEKQKILSIRISLPQEGRSGSRPRSQSTHASPNTVMSTAANLQDFDLKLDSDSETDSVDSSDKQEVDPLQALQGIASATPTACNGAGNSKQHNNESVVSSGLVAAFQLPAWRLAPELDVPQFRVVDDYGDCDPHFGEGYDFMSAAWSQERVNPNAPALKRKKPRSTKWALEDDPSSEVTYHKLYCQNKRRSLPPASSSSVCSSGTDVLMVNPEIEDTSDAVYQKLHSSQEKEEKERMTSLYNNKLKEGGEPKGKDSVVS